MKKGLCVERKTVVGSRVKKNGFSAESERMLRRKEKHISIWILRT